MAHQIIQVPSGGGGGAAAAPAAGGGGAAAAVEEKKEEKVEEKVCDLVNYFSMDELTSQCRRNPTTTWASDCSIKCLSFSIVVTRIQRAIWAYRFHRCCIFMKSRFEWHDDSNLNSHISTKVYGPQMALHHNRLSMEEN